MERTEKDGEPRGKREVNSDEKCFGGKRDAGKDGKG
jgi:hypothetical protein